MNKINFNFPPKVAKKLKEKYKNATSADIEVALSGALSYFALCKEYPKGNIPMYSVVVDEVWHEFILHTKDYAKFCEEHIGFFLHHIPNEENVKVDNKKEREQILSLWVLACQSEGFDPTNVNATPNLFYADVAFEEKDVFSIVDLAKETKQRAVANAKEKNKKPNVFQNLKNNLGFSKERKTTQSGYVDSGTGNFDFNNVLLSVIILDDIKPAVSSYTPPVETARSFDVYHDSGSSSKHSCGGSSSSKHSCSSGSSSSGSSCSSCGGGGGD